MSTMNVSERHGWVRFRRARNAALAEPHGWLTLTSLQWLDGESRRVADVPGRWSVTDDTATLIATPDDALTELTTGQVVDGMITASLDDEESLLWVGYGGASGRRVVVELARRAGRNALRTRDAEAPAFTDFGGVPVFDYQPDYVVGGHFLPYDASVDEPIRTANPQVAGTHRTVGEIVFQLPGNPTEHRLHATREQDGSLSVTFHDRTNGTTTAGWRKLSIARPQADGSVLLDFNRAINYPSAFTPYGTCPMPVEANVVAAAVEAGERAPRR